MALVGEEHLRELTWRTPEHLRDRCALDADADGVDEHHATDALRIPGGQLERHPAPERAPEHRRLREVEQLPHVEQMEDRVLHAVDLLDALRLAEPGKHRHDHLVVVGEVLEDREHALPGRGVEVHELGAASAAEHLELADRRVDSLLRERGHWTRPPATPMVALAARRDTRLADARDSVFARLRSLTPPPWVHGARARRRGTRRAIGA